MTSAISASLIPCDSCGHPASPEHIHDRLARLQRATRYRPIHISLLLICPAPPQKSEDDLYALELEQGSAESRAYLAALLACLGIGSPAQPTPAAQLAELQHRGIYLARVVECPLAPGSSVTNFAALYGETLLKRISLSYKPKRIALLDPVLPGLPELLLKSPVGSQLVSAGKGIEIPNPTDQAAIAKVHSILFE